MQNIFKKLNKIGKFDKTWARKTITSKDNSYDTATTLFKSFYIIAMTNFKASKIK